MESIAFTLPLNSCVLDVSELDSVTLWPLSKQGQLKIMAGNHFCCLCMSPCSSDHITTKELLVPYVWSLRRLLATNLYFPAKTKSVAKSFSCFGCLLIDRTEELLLFGIFGYSVVPANSRVLVPPVINGTYTAAEPPCAALRIDYLST